MAKASTGFDKVEKVVSVEEEFFTLKMDRAEAETLLDVLGFIGGAPDTSRRGIADKLQEAIASVLYVDEEVVYNEYDIVGEIKFLSRSNLPS